MDMVISMKRKRLTQIFPFLLPLRVREKEFFYHLRLKMNGNYASIKRENVFHEEVTHKRVLLINEDSGYDIEYQYNKRDNIKIAGKKINRVIIKPGEVFSFWYLVGKISAKNGYKKGLCISDGKMTYAYGGGLCLLSNFLFELFLETPLTIQERHPHAYESFRPNEGDILGTDATIVSGWLDLKMKNNTNMTFQILIETDDQYLYGAILSNHLMPYHYKIVEENGTYLKNQDEIYYDNDIIKEWYHKETNILAKREFLYHSHILIRYPVTEKDLS